MELRPKINNAIIVKVGSSIITSLDIKNEIITNLTINKIEVTQENINNKKNVAVKNLVSNSIKKNEIKKYKIIKYNKKDLENYVEKIAKNLNTNRAGLKDIFKGAGISYDKLTEKYITELLWNTLIYKLYSNQININLIEVDNEIKTIKENNNEFNFGEIKEQILSKKKGEKLNLFSRSHFSNLENTIKIDFK